LRFQNSGAEVLSKTTVFAAPVPGVLLAECADGAREIRYSKLVLSTGARELFLPFPGWTLPGVMGPGGLQALVKAGWPIHGQRGVVAGSGPLLLAVSEGLKRHGACVVAVAEQASWSQVLAFGASLWRQPAKLGQALRLLPPAHYRCGAWPVRAEGSDQVKQVT